jgi:hypothetical protein
MPFLVPFKVYVDSITPEIVTCANAPVATRAATATRVFFISKFSKGLTKGSGYGTPSQPPIRKLRVFDQSTTHEAMLFVHFRVFSLSCDNMHGFKY